MPTKEEAKQEVQKLIEFYNSNKDSFRESSEADIRIKLIDRLFEILGWDVWGRKTGSEVTREETVKMKESKKKKADYAFRLHGIPKFVVEAKAIKNIDLTSDEFREQAVGYAYNLACSWAVLTNFVKTRIYFVDKEDGVVTFNISDISDLESFDKHFEILWFLSNEAVKDDLLGKYLDDKGIKPQKGSVGKQLYEDLKEWRSILSSEIKSKYKDYEKYVIEEIVQRIIDRLIFIRKVEDMEIEERKLEQLTRRFNEGKTYEQLKIIFRTYRQKYNSGLFGEKEEHECDRISISDKPIETMIRGMYVPKGRRIEYNFAVIDADVLGNIYEQYLAYILQETPKKAKLEGGRSHRKEQGIYYTPIYIVDYIVKNTVSEALKDKSIDEILSAKILDPACGSGSFLIRAFSEVCRIVEDKMKKGERSKISPSLKDYSGRLTMKQKIAILLSCIYGVDLDKKAVEIAQLNLLFKLLEGETAETISQIEGLRKILPTLGANIKHGNSLIDDRKIAGDDAFNWEEQFSDIMKSGGFDIVIGNPPYIRQEELLPIKNHLESHYEVFHSMADLFAYFFERELKIMNREGYFGMIVSNKWLKAGYGLKLRKFLQKYWIEQFFDFGDLQVFQDATTYPCIIIMKQINKQNPKISVCQVRTLDFESLETYVKRNTFIINQKDLDENGWNFQSNDNEKLLEKIRKASVPLKDYVNKEVYRGILTGLNEAFVIDEETRAKLIKNDPKSAEIIKPFLTGNEVGRYFIHSKGRYLIFTRRGIDIDNYPSIKNYLEQFKTELTPKKNPKQQIGRKPGDYKWYEIQDVIAYYKEFEKPKIIYGKITTQPRFTIDTKGFFVNDSNFFFPIVDKKLLGILNSKLGWFLIQNTCTQIRGGYQLIWKYFGNVPIYKEKSPELEKLVDKMLSLNKKLSEMKAKTDARARLEEEIKKTDAEIDELVYKLYGITEDEKKIIEKR